MSKEVFAGLRRSIRRAVDVWFGDGPRRNVGDISQGGGFDYNDEDPAAHARYMKEIRSLRKTTPR